MLALHISRTRNSTCSWVSTVSFCSETMKIHWCTTCLVVVVLLGVLTDAQNIWTKFNPTQKPIWPPTQKPNWPNWPKPIRPITQRPIWPPTQKPNWPNWPKPIRPITQRPIWPPTQKPNWPSWPVTQKPNWPSWPVTQKPNWPSWPVTQKPNWPVKPVTQKPNWPSWPVTQKPNWPSWPPTQKPNWPIRPPTQKPHWPVRPPTQKPNWPVRPPTQKPHWPGKPGWPPIDKPMWPIGLPSPIEIPVTLPAIGDGFQNPLTPPDCSVDQNVRITCGSGITSASDCSAINCCFDGQRCFYGKMVTVQATKDGQIVVVVSKYATLPPLDLNSIRLRSDGDPQCRPVAFNSVFIVYQFPVTACGTSVTESTDVIIYENSMESSYEINVGSLGSITRDSYFRLAFQVRYKGVSVKSLMVEILDKSSPFDVYGEGPLKLELRLANGQCPAKGRCSDDNIYYSSYYAISDYPITRVLREPVYVEVRVRDKTDASVVLLLNRCWATNTPHPHSMPQWNLLVGGCPNPNDNKYLTTLVPVVSSPDVPYPSHYKRFIVKMFTFIDQSTRLPLNNQVFFHCSASVCHSGVANCQQACLRKRRDLSVSPSAEEGVVVSSGAVIFTEGSLEQIE